LGYQSYTRGNYVTLPTDDADLESVYSESDLTDVSTKNNVWVSQGAIGEYAIHLFKDHIGASDNITLEWEGQSSLAPTLSTIYLQIYNYNSSAWETVDSDNISSVDTDFTLSGSMANLTNYKNNEIICCRVYQEGI
jgi:hypothetical protein